MIIELKEPTYCPDGEQLIWKIAKDAIRNGCIVATDGYSLRVMQEPLPPGWARVAITEKVRT